VGGLGLSAETYVGGGSLWVDTPTVTRPLLRTVLTFRHSVRDNSQNQHPGEGARIHVGGTVLTFNHYLELADFALRNTEVMPARDLSKMKR
jgi:hypothetical protein